MKKQIILTVLLILVTVIANAQLSSSSSMIVTRTRHRLPPVKAGYEQHIDASFSCITTGENEFEGSLTYIGGYRFNNYIFLGLGAGVSVSDGDSHAYHDDYYYDGLPYPMVNVPVFVHLRVYFLKTRVSPYFALSAGGRFSGKGTFELESGNEVKYNTCGVYLAPSIGLNIRLNKRTSLYFAAGYRGTSTSDISYGGIQYNSLTVHNELYHSLDFHLGFTF
ncbi:MAG: hypothetical protein ACI3ZQ_04550 [Candidatus Cryptobacteroides sp.]